MRRRYIQDPETHKLIPAEEYHRPGPQSPHIQTMEPFVSPIDGQVIDDPGKLRAHNRKHGVVDSREFSPEYIQERAKERVNRTTGDTKAARQERIELIKHTLEQADKVYGRRR